jgi:hypothetical protein
MKPWIRLYSEIIDDPKVQLLPPDQFRMWINFMCLASSAGGKVEISKQVAWRLRVSAEELSQSVSYLTDAGLLDREVDGGVCIHNWKERQFESDDRTKLTRDWRKKQTTEKSEEVKQRSIVSRNNESLFHETTSGCFTEQRDVVSRNNIETVSDTDTDSDTDSDAVVQILDRATARQRPEFDWSEPDPTQMIRAKVEQFAEAWLEPGNVPRAAAAAEREFVKSNSPVVEWLGKIQVSFDRWSEHHATKRFRDRKHFIPHLERWFYDGDYSRRPPGQALAVVATQEALCGVCGGCGVVYPDPPAELQGEARLDWLASRGEGCGACGGAA